MIGYIHLLDQLDVKKTLVPDRARLVFILSGQSDFAHSELSQVQKDLLNYCRQYDYATLDIGFPYNKDHQFQEVKRAGIVMATIRNILQFLFLIFSSQYRRIVAKHLQPVFRKANQIFIIGQSSGLHILKSCLPYLNIKPDSEINVLALGPVVWGKFSDARFKLITVKGDHDWITWLLDRQSISYLIPCNHFNYCKSKDVLKIIDGILEK